MTTSIISIKDIFCRNKDCLEYQKATHPHIRKFGKTSKGIQRFQCKKCNKTFIATQGSVFHRKRHTPETILECLSLVAENKTSLASLHRKKGIKEETISDWLKQVGTHTEEIEKIILSQYPIEQTQLEFLRKQIQNRQIKEAKK